MPLLSFLRTWSPFHIDALGLVTLLGSEEVDTTLGQLCENPLTAYLPLLGGHMIAGDHITKPRAGYALYNINDGIKATDLAGWFSRWLDLEALTFSSSTLHISKDESPKPRVLLRIAGLICGFLALAPFALAIVIGDWWATSNSAALQLSIIVRVYMLAQNCNALDRAADRSSATSTDPVRALITLPDGRAVTVVTTRGILLDCLLTKPRPSQPGPYWLARVVGWAAFGVHIIALGMASLVCQILTVAVMLVATLATTYELGTDRYCVAGRLRIARTDTGDTFRAAMYASLGLGEEEEQCMVNWNLCPQRTNAVWWEMYRSCMKDNNFQHWDQILANGTAPDGSEPEYL